MAKYTEEVKELLELIGGKGKHFRSVPLHDEDAICPCR